MARRYSLRLDGRTIELPASVMDDDESERYARIAVMTRYDCPARIGEAGWMTDGLGRHRHLFAARPSGVSEYVGRIECAEVEPKKTF